MCFRFLRPCQFLLDVWQICTFHARLDIVTELVPVKPWAAEKFNVKQEENTVIIDKMDCPQSVFILLVVVWCCT